MDGPPAQTDPTARPRPERTIDDYVGERIRQRRTELGLTQEELGKLLSLSYQQVQKYETGANRVSAGRLYEIARELGIGVAYFFDGYEKSGATAPLPHGGHNRAAIELVRNFLEIEDENLRTAVSSLLKAVKDQQG